MKELFKQLEKYMRQQYKCLQIIQQIITILINKYQQDFNIFLKLTFYLYYHYLINHSQINQQNQMSLKPSRPINNIGIKRIKIKESAMSNPQDSPLPSRQQVQHILTSKSLIHQSDSNASKGVMFTNTIKNNFYYTKVVINNNDVSNRQQSRIYTESKQKKPNIKQKELRSSKQFDLQTSKMNKSQRNASTISEKYSKTLLPNKKRMQKNRIVHMNYREYEDLIEKMEIIPTYFQDIAKRNDDFLITRDTLQNNEKSMKNRDKRLKTQPIITTNLPTLLKKRKPQTLKSVIQSNNSIKTIIGCPLGVLSNNQIKQKLEQRWISQQKEVIQRHNNTLIFTQQSDIVSEMNSIQNTQRQPTLRIKDRKKDMYVHRNKEDVDWSMIQNQKIRTNLQKILKLKPKMNSNSEQGQFSRGQEYQQKQQSLLTFHNIYEPKIFTLKHKLGWKI